MKLKIFTLSTLFLFFSIKTTAQVTHAPASNIVDITFLISDNNDDLTFVLTHEDEYLISTELDLVFRINLNDQSELDMVGFFGLQYDIYRVSLDGLLRQHIRGVTVPVIIPPVRKKRVRSSESEEYPFEIRDQTDLVQANYEVKMNLVKYHTRADYLANNENYTAYTRIGFLLIATVNHITSSRNAPDLPSLIAYPNPTLNELVIEYSKTTPKNNFSQNVPVEVVIFNDKGIKVSTHTLTVVSGNNRMSYQLNTSHLPKGMYFCQIKRGEKTEVKTILKE